MTTTFTAPTSCPHCAATIDAASSVGEDATPSAGDITLCCTCGEFSQFTTDLELEMLNPALEAEIEQDENCQRVKRAWYRMKQEEKRHVH